MPSIDLDFLNLSYGRAFYAQVSFDGFATIAYYWGTHAGVLDGTNVYEQRLAKVGSISRALGQERVAASASLELLLENVDQGVDWMLTQASWAQVTQARFKLWTGIYDSTGTVVGVYQVGTFVCGDNPRRNNARVQIHLVDDLQGPLLQPVSLPTARIWGAAAASTDANCPYTPAQGEMILFDDKQATLDTVIPLAFGEDWVPTSCLGVPASPNAAWKDPSTNFYRYAAVPICCTTNSSSAIAALSITSVRLVSKGLGRVLEVPSTYQNSGFLYTADYSTTSPTTVWQAVKSAAVIVDGRTFYVVYLKVDLAALYASIYDRVNQDDGGDFYDVNLSPLGPTVGRVGRLLILNSEFEAKRGSSILQRCNMYVKGYPLSSIRTIGATTAPNVQHGANILHDLVSNYTKGLGVANLDVTRIDRVIRASPNGSAAGIIGRRSTDEATLFRFNSSDTSMRDVMTALAQSCDFDVFTTWDGKIATSCDLTDYLTYTGLASYMLLAEEDVTDVEDFFPSAGERGAPFNRVYLEGSRSSPAEGDAGSSSEGKKASGNPFDEPIVIAAWGRVIEKRLQQGWRSYEKQQGNPFYNRSIDTRIRQRISFKCDMAQGFQLELGDFFRFNWSRGGGASVYANTIFQCERLDFATDSNSVQVEAIWKDDIITEAPYLLDDEALGLLLTGSGARQVQLTDSNATVVFSSGSLVTDGILAGHMLVLKDSSQAENVFTRNRVLRITNVTSGITATVATDDALALNFGAGAGLFISQWEIRRGKTRLPTAGADLVNYPDDSAMYGCATSAADVYSNASAGNKLRNG
jgi:hypothetical protein